MHQRITSIDALRGFVMFMMIVVNDLAGAGKIVPDWMVHYSDRHTGSGMTFVDVVFPAFLFIVGMSIPFALGGRLERGESIASILRHVIGRTLLLLAIGVLMVNKPADSALMGYSATLWATLMYVSAICACCEMKLRGVSKDMHLFWFAVSLCIRLAGFALMAFLAVSFVGPHGERIISFSPLAINVKWWGILGLIGWAYFVGSLVYLAYARVTQRSGTIFLYAAMALLILLFTAAKHGMFGGWWIAEHINIGAALGTQAAIVVGGITVAMLVQQGKEYKVLNFIAATALGGWLLQDVYGISKEAATPAWALYACASTAALWFLISVADVHATAARMVKPLTLAGGNVLLAYLLSGLVPTMMPLFDLGGWYWKLSQPDVWHALARAVGLAIVVLSATAWLNSKGFRVKL